MTMPEQATADPTLWEKFIAWQNSQQDAPLPPPAPPIPGVPPPAPPAQPEPEPEPAPSAAKGLPEVGETVEFRWFDPRVGSDGEPNTSRFGVVVEVVHTHADGSPIYDADGQPAPAARIGWFTEVSDPVPITDLAW